MNFLRYKAYNVPLRKVRGNIGDISKRIFGYDIVSKPYLKDMDDRCSYFRITLEYIPRVGTDILIEYTPLKMDQLQERYYAEFIASVRRYLKYETLETKKREERINE